MKEFKAKIKDPVGLHARPASIVVKTASDFQSDITIISGDKTGNLKSIMNVMALGVKQGEEVTIQAVGEDEEDAIKAIQEEMKKNNLT